MYKEIAPIPETPEDYEELEKLIMRVFREEIYIPLLAEINQKGSILQNSINDLLEAISSGQIWFYRGEFKGRFDSRVSRELKRLGATRDRQHGSFKIPLSSIPVEIKNVILASEKNFNQTLSRINKKIDAFVPKDIAAKFKMEKIFEKTIFKVDKRVSQSLKNITVAPQLTEAGKEKLASDYTNNMQLYIQKFTEDEIIKLRENVQRRVFSGVRYENLVKSIKHSYGVSQRKAKFLARQETSILMAKFKQTRYQDAGVDRYKWRCVPNARPLHKVHNNKIYSFSSPPVVDSKGNRKNPGEDYGCRCTAIPIVRF